MLFVIRGLYFKVQTLILNGTTKPTWQYIVILVFLKVCAKLYMCISCFSSYGNNWKFHPLVLEHSHLKGMISSIPGKIYM